MFGSLGFPEILFILVLALLIFGPRRLPEVGRTIGKGLSEFRRATHDLKRSIETEIALEEPPRRPTPVPPSTAGAQPPAAADPAAARPPHDAPAAHDAHDALDALDADAEPAPPST